MSWSESIPTLNHLRVTLFHSLQSQPTHTRVPSSSSWPAFSVFFSFSFSLFPLRSVQDGRVGAGESICFFISHRRRLGRRRSVNSFWSRTQQWRVCALVGGDARPLTALVYFLYSDILGGCVLYLTLWRRDWVDVMASRRKIKKKRGNISRRISQSIYPIQLVVFPSCRKTIH